MELHGGWRGGQKCGIPGKKSISVRVCWLVGWLVVVDGDEALHAAAMRSRCGRRRVVYGTGIEMARELVAGSRAQ
jgi:hypothetical protein